MITIIIILGLTVFALIKGADTEFFATGGEILQEFSDFTGSVWNDIFGSVKDKMKKKKERKEKQSKNKTNTKK